MGCAWQRMWECKCTCTAGRFNVLLVQHTATCKTHEGARKENVFQPCIDVKSGPSQRHRCACWFRALVVILCEMRSWDRCSLDTLLLLSCPRFTWAMEEGWDGRATNAEACAQVQQAKKPVSRVHTILRLNFSELHQIVFLYRNQTDNQQQRVFDGSLADCCRFVSRVNRNVSYSIAVALFLTTVHLQRK